MDKHAHREWTVRAAAEAGFYLLAAKMPPRIDAGMDPIMQKHRENMQAIPTSNPWSLARAPSCSPASAPPSSDGLDEAWDAVMRKSS